ncbi:hypothetical protein AB0F72_41045 [Actinoplanes sp. NPDC023936]
MASSRNASRGSTADARAVELVVYYPDAGSDSAGKLGLLASLAR